MGKKITSAFSILTCYKPCRGVGSYIKLCGQVVIWGTQSTPQVAIGLTDLPKSGLTIANSTHPSLKPLNLLLLIIITFSHLNNRLWPAEVMKPLWWFLLTKNSSRNWNFPFLPIRMISKSKTKWLLLTKVLVSKDESWFKKDFGSDQK